MYDPNLPGPSTWNPEEYSEEAMKRARLKKNLQMNDKTIEQMILHHAETEQAYWEKQNLNFTRQVKTIIFLSIEGNIPEEVERGRKKERIKKLNKVLEEQQIATDKMAKISHNLTKIAICYNEIMQKAQFDKLPVDNAEKYLSSIYDVTTNMSLILVFCKTGEIEDKLTKRSDALVKNIRNLRSKLFTELNIPPNTGNGEIYNCSNNYAIEYEKKYKTLLEDNRFRTFRNECFKAIIRSLLLNPPMSEKTMINSLMDLLKLLRGDRVLVVKDYVSALDHPEGHFFCTSLLAKKIIEQSGRVVATNVNIGFTLATITMAIWGEFEDFGKVLQGHFILACPYLAPKLLPKSDELTEMEYYVTRGYNFRDGMVETQDQYLLRMSGIFTLMCAIWGASTPSMFNETNPHGIRHGYKWLIEFINNLNPEPQISSTLLLIFFTICGAYCQLQFGDEFTIMTKFICSVYLEKLNSMDRGGATAKLKAFLQKVMENDYIVPLMSGRPLPYRW